MKGLDNLTNLTNLIIKHNQITEVKGLKNLYKLQCLNFSLNPAEDKYESSVYIGDDLFLNDEFP
jgi:Leucine-rich repeat (LRR) protein